MPFKLTLVSDVRSFLKGTQDVEKGLDQVADSLDQLASDTQTSAKDAADALSREFSESFDKVKTEAKTTGRKVGDELKDGTRRASQGVSEMGDEAKSSAREMAASFDGSAESISDLVQEIAANALPALGPAGAAAGLALAVGLGAGISALQGIKDKSDEAKEKALELADVIDGAQGNPELINWAQELRGTFKEIVDSNELWEVWQKAPVDRLTQWSSMVKEYGVSMQDLVKASAGEGDALGRVNSIMDEHIAQLTAAGNQASNWSGTLGSDYVKLIQDAQAFKDDVNAQATAVADAASWQQTYADATKDLAEKHKTAEENAKAQSAATQLVTDAQSRATQASQTFSDGLTNNLSVADEGLDKFVKKGKLKIGEWTDELNSRAKQNTRIKDFTVDVDTKLSPEALQSFEQLPTETQDLIAKAYKSGSKGDRKKILANLEAEAKIDKVTVDTSGIKAAPVEVPVTVLTAGAITGTADAATAAQREANRSDNRIEFDTHIDVAELQRKVNRAAAQITPPTVWANVKVRKEVP